MKRGNKFHWKFCFRSKTTVAFLTCYYQDKGLLDMKMSSTWPYPSLSKAKYSFKIFIINYKRNFRLYSHLTDSRLWSLLNYCKAKPGALALDNKSSTYHWMKVPIPLARDSLSIQLEGIWWHGHRIFSQSERINLPPGTPKIADPRLGFHGSVCFYGLSPTRPCNQWILLNLDVDIIHTQPFQTEKRKGQWRFQGRECSH